MAGSRLARSHCDMSFLAMLTTPIWRPEMNRPSVLALVLAGGEGSRLGPDGRTREAGPFAGTYRLIDFPCRIAHSGIGDVWVIQQYEPHELTKQLANGRPWISTARTAGCGSCILPR